MAAGDQVPVPVSEVIGCAPAVAARSSYQASAGLPPRGRSFRAKSRAERGWLGAHSHCGYAFLSRF
jgi:hypothetical protein